MLAGSANNKGKCIFFCLVFSLTGANLKDATRHLAKSANGGGAISIAERKQSRCDMTLVCIRWQRHA
jgi:hypothetical protein